MGKYDEGFAGDKSNSMRVEGIDSLLESFAEIPKAIKGKHLQNAMKRAVQPMVKELAALTPHGPTGNLLEAVGFRVRNYGGAAGASGAVFGIVGYKRAVSRPTGDTLGYHSSWIEFGTEDRTPKQAKALSAYKLAESGYTPPGWRFVWPMNNVKRAAGLRGYHPLGRAYSSTAQRCADILAVEMALALDKAIDENRRKGGD
jgi:hypothetical protein